MEHPSEKIPIIRLRNCLLVSIQVNLHDQLLQDLATDLGQRIATQRPRAVILDLSSVGLIDSFMTRIINNISNMSRLMGARTVIAGIQPEVAITLVQMGIAFQGIETVLGLDHALELLGIREVDDGAADPQQGPLDPERFHGDDSGDLA